MTDLERLEEIKGWIEPLNLHCDIIEKSEAIPLDVLLIYLGDEQDEDRMLQLAFMPISTEDISFTKLLQFYLVIGNQVNDQYMGDVLVSMNHVNTRTVLGYYGINEANQAFYRYVHAMSSILDSEVSFQEMLTLILVNIEMHGELLRKISIGELSVEDALDHLAKT